jgi:hypothetical protein
MLPLSINSRFRRDYDNGLATLMYFYYLRFLRFALLMKE